MRIHDLIIGDFGRAGTIRYFQAFSEAEQDLLQKQQQGTFYDEYRMIRYTIIGLLRDIKKQFIPPDIDRIDDSVLVGVNGGPSPIEIFPDLLRVLSPYVVQASKEGATEVRIIIPCNTLFKISKQLNFVLSSRDSLLSYLNDNAIKARWADQLLEIFDSTIITVPAVAEVVVDKLNDDNTSRLLVSASKAAEKAYKEIIDKEHDDLEFQAWLPPGVKSFPQLLKKTIRGEQLNTNSAESQEDATIVSGCTDIALPFGHDSATIFAQQMAFSAYRNLDVISR